MTGRERALLALDLSLEKQAQDPVLLDITAKATYAEYLLVMSGKTERQVRALADHLVERLEAHGIRPIGIEGFGTQWILLDYGDFVVHVFAGALRTYYDLEGLWFDAVRVPIEVPPENRLSAADAY